jgi:hypothetical protein
LSGSGGEEESVPLSEHEQRLLEQMERALYAEDPKFASSLRGKDPRSNFRRRLLLAVVGFIVGVVLLMTGLVAQVILVSVLGFLLMLGSAFFAVTSYRAVTAANQLGVVEGGAVRKPRTATRRSKSTSSSAGFMQRIEERWNRRRDDDGR